MTDVAHLRYDIDSSPAQDAANDLDRMAAASKKAEQAALSMSGGSQRAASAMQQMAESVARADRELIDMARYERAAAVAADQAAASTRSLASAANQVSPALAKASRDAKAAASHFDTLFDAVNHNFATQYAAQMGAVVRANDNGAKSSKGLSLAALDLSRQFADVGVTAAMGMNPLMILLQQGPQIADRLALMKMEGIGLSAALRSIAVSAAPVLAVLAPIAAVGGAVFGLAALGARQLNKDNEDLVAGLGLTEKQLKKLKDEGVDTGVTIGDVFKGTFNYIRDSIAPSLAPLSKWFSDLFDRVATGAVDATKAIAGGFAGAFEYIKTVWANLPAVVGDAAISAANAVLRTIDQMVNFAIAKINSLIEKANAAAGAVGLDARLPTLASGSVGEIANPYAGQAAATFQTADAAAQAAAKRAAAGVDSILGGLGKAIIDAAKDRIRKESGDAGKTKKGPATPRDMSDERSAQIDAMLAQAKAEELRAQLDLTEDLRRRAALEKEIGVAQLAAKQAGIDRQLANVAYDVERKRLTKAAGDELAAQLNAVKAVNQRVADLQADKIDRDLQRAMTKQATEIEASALQNQIDLLSGQADIARFASERAVLDQKILDLQHRIERAKIKEVIDTTASGTAAHETAVAQMAIRDEVEAAAREGLRLRILASTTGEAASAIRDVADAVRDHDWGRAFTSLINAVDQAIAAFATAKTAAERMTATGSVFSAAGGAIGGTAGGILGAVGSGFSAAGAAAGMAGSFGALGGAIAGLAGPIGIAVGGLSLLSGIFGKNKAKEEAKNREALARAEAELDRVREVAAQKRDLEIQLMEATGNAAGALAARRQDELRALDASNRALQEAVWAAQDLAEARQKEVDAAQSLVDDAHSRLSEAYEREAGALQDYIDRFQSWSDSLSKFLKGLYSGPAAMLSPEEQYRAARAEFDRVSAAAASGDENAIRDLESVSQAYLDASKDYYASSKEYFRDLERVRSAVSATQNYAAAQVDVGQAQLTALNASVAGILNVNASVLSVRDALAAYQAAVQQLAAAQAAQKAANDNAAPGGGASQAPDWASYISKNTDVANEYLRNMNSAKGRDYLASLGINSVQDFGRWHWETFGKAEGRTPFAAGGIMDRPITLGESGIGAEAGPEGILPLANVNGKMGVHAVGGGDEEEKALLRTLIAKQDAIIAELQADKVQRTAMAEEQAKQSKKMDDTLAQVGRGLRAA